MIRSSKSWATFQLMHGRLAGSSANSRGYNPRGCRDAEGLGRSKFQIDREHSPALKAAIRELRSILGNGQWREKDLVSAVADKHGVPLSSLRRIAGVFESDSKKYVCVLTDDTPDLAPDES